MTSESLSPMAERILAYMARRSPVERLCRRAELDTLGSASEVGQALVTLADTQRIGSPGRDIWFPLEAHVAQDGTETVLPPAPLKEMAESLLRREGVNIVISPQERDYRLYHATQGKEGVWGMPSFEDIGVDRPVPLLLHWGRCRVHTVYNQERTMPADPSDSVPEPSADPEGFRHAAYRMGALPVRLEQDFRVNHALRVLGSTPQPAQGLLLFTGGTCLTKAWRLSSRFSEDIDLRFQGDEDMPHTSESVKRAVHAHVETMVRRHLLPHLPGGRLDKIASRYRKWDPVQRLEVQCNSRYASASVSMKIDIAFTPGRVPWTRHPVYVNPAHEPLLRNRVITHLPCMPRWAIMAGKLHAVAVMRPGADMADMRHIVDLGRWIEGAAHPADYPFMVRQSQSESATSDLMEGLWDNLDTLSRDPHCACMFEEYLARMFPGNAVTEAPDYHEALERIRDLWQGLCESDWDNPDLVMDIPPVSSYTESDTPRQRPCQTPPPTR